MALNTHKHSEISQGTVGIKQFHSVIATLPYSHKENALQRKFTGNRAYRFDPTRTTTLRKAYAREMSKRFMKIRRLIWEAIVTDDCFGLAPPVNPFKGLAVPYRAFNFPTSAGKVEAFMTWLQEQVNNELLGVSVRVGSNL